MTRGAYVPCNALYEIVQLREYFSAFDRECDCTLIVCKDEESVVVQKLIHGIPNFRKFQMSCFGKMIRSGEFSMSELPADPAREDVLLTRESEFEFACHADLPCFTQCCRDVNIYLTPYDVLRLRRALKMGSREFLAKHTRNLSDKDSHIPMVQLAMDEQTLCCKLVSDRGCQVYGDRPWACRMYPLDLADQEGHYRFFVTRERCFGLREKRSLTVQQWLDDQDVAPYMEMEWGFQQIMPPVFQPGQRMDADLGRLMYLAYDLDRFARMLEDRLFREMCDVDDEMLARLKEDEDALLLLALRYIRAQQEVLLQVV
jgi:Fe-S-cluster containining protein